MRGLLGVRRGRGQGGRLRGAGSGGALHQRHQWQFLGRDGSAPLRNRGTSARRRNRPIHKFSGQAMSAEILVNVMPRETRAALVESGVMQELFIERANRVGITSNIYKGRVSRVLPGMHAAFVDVGLERTAV